MEIIKEGKINISYYQNCYFCGCQFKYDNNDIYIDYSLTWPQSYVMCPCCHRRVGICNYWPSYLPNTIWPNSPYGGWKITCTGGADNEQT